MGFHWKNIFKPKPKTMPDIKTATPELVTESQFVEMCQIVIDNFESGYYHPNMLSKMKASDQALLMASGETMYGLDRKAGAELAKFPEWAEFWKEIDLAGGATKWVHYYIPPDPLKTKLKILCSKIMFKWFTYLSRKYILVGSMDEIAADKRLIIHFSYSCWNGEDWFKKYSAALNKAILKYDNKPNEKDLIFNEAIKARTEATNKVGLPNKAIRNQGIKMMNLFKAMKLV